MLYLCLTYAISVCNRLQAGSEPPAPSQGSPADAQRDISLLPCFLQPTVLGWGGLSTAPHPGRRLGFWQGFPSEGLCGSGGLERGQHSGFSPLTDARRRTEAALLRWGLAPRARRSLQELPWFPLRGGQRQRQITNHCGAELRGLSSAPTGQPCCREHQGMGRMKGRFCLLLLHPALYPPTDGQGPSLAVVEHPVPQI